MNVGAGRETGLCWLFCLVNELKTDVFIKQINSKQTNSTRVGITLGE